MKKITVTLSEGAEKYFNDLMYSLTGENDKPATPSECINESLITLRAFEQLTDDQLANWLEENYSWPHNTTAGRFIGIKDAKGKKVCEGDMYYEEIPEDDGDTRIFFVVKWLKEWAMFAMLSLGEIPDYEDNGIDALDDSSRNTFILDASQFERLHYKGNVKSNPELMELENKQSFE